MIILEKIILVILAIGYGVLIALMLELMKEIQRIHKILWKVAQNESFDFILAAGIKAELKDKK